MLTADVSTQILHTVDQGFSEQLQLSQELVRFPSTPGQEALAQALIARAAQVLSSNLVAHHLH
tara:strand:+ start:79 stop:267 length:189 start_codon:yes stop_codon:yes gene_type:complete